MAERSTEGLACRVLAQERAAVSATLSEALEAFKAPDGGSPRAADLAWIAGRRWAVRERLTAVLDSAAFDVQEILRSAHEHVQAIETLLGADEMLPIPAMTLVRSIHESVLTICWLTDPLLAPAERLTRVAALRLTQSQGSHRTIGNFPENLQGDSERVRRAMDDTQRYLNKAGFVLGFGKAGGPYALSVSHGDVATSLKMNATAASRRYTPGIHYIWTTGSGATHSRLWFTSGLEGPWAQLVVMIASPLLDMSDALIDNALGYVSLDPTECHRRTHLRRQALLGRARHLGDTTHGYADYATQRDAAPAVRERGRGQAAGGRETAVERTRARQSDSGGDSAGGKAVRVADLRQPEGRQ